jgi:hypothetical protein
MSDYKSEGFFVFKIMNTISSRYKNNFGCCHFFFYKRQKLSLEIFGIGNTSEKGMKLCV